MFSSFVCFLFCLLFSLFFLLAPFLLLQFAFFFHILFALMLSLVPSSLTRPPSVGWGRRIYEYSGRVFPLSETWTICQLQSLTVTHPLHLPQGEVFTNPQTYFGGACQNCNIAWRLSFVISSTQRSYDMRV